MTKKHTFWATWVPRLAVWVATAYALAGAVLYAFGGGGAGAAAPTKSVRPDAPVPVSAPSPAFPIRVERSGGIAVPYRGRADLPRRLTFPVGGPAHVTESFGDPRGSSRHHAGIDIMAPKGTPVLAAADGVVRWMHDGATGSCCDVALIHEGGWRTRYIHLNNDTPGTDDGRGYGIAPGLAPGVEVAEGQLVGWVGDSGNAEHTAPHLHFELRRPDGTPVDAYEVLLAAQERVPRSGTIR